MRTIKQIVSQVEMEEIDRYIQQQEKKEDDKWVVKLIESLNLD